MDLQEIENALLVVKWVYPIMSGAFFMIISLLIYIWKTNTNKTDELLKQSGDTLTQLRILVENHNIRIKHLEDK